MTSTKMLGIELIVLDWRILVKPYDLHVLKSVVDEGKVH